MEGGVFLIGLLIGIGCGALELFLLKKLVDAVTDAQRIPLPVILLKVLGYAAFLVPCAIWFPAQIQYAGIAVAVILAGGGFVLYFLGQRKLKQQDLPSSGNHEELP